MPSRDHTVPALSALRVILGVVFLAILTFIPAGASRAADKERYGSPSDFEKYAMKLRENALLKVEPQVVVPTVSTSPMTTAARPSRYPWKRNIVTTVFWVGEKPTQNNPVPNTKSSWDPEWVSNFGGFDNPDMAARKGFRPANFLPRQNPFYIALPYNDVTRGTTKPEASRVIPWFKETFIGQGKTVVKGRWIAIRRGNRVCYAQWEDCGPFRTDHWQYVFGNARPSANLNQGAGLDVSPAVRDYLGLKGKDVTDWRFVDFREVPQGPWAQFGDNNTFVILKRRGAGQLAMDINNLGRRSAIR